MEIVPAETRDVPEGSRIPERRLYEIQQKVQAYQSKMRERAAQGLQGAPQQDPQNPDNDQ